MTQRRCSDCTLCCRLLPTRELKKAANERCKHQRLHGCAIYAQRPMSCRLWSCRWLVNDDTEPMRRPDRSHYVIDIMPDYVTVVNNETGERTNIEVIQVWCDPKHPDAWQDPDLMDYLERRGEEGKAAIIRWGSKEGMTVFPPSMASDKQWHTRRGMAERQHTTEELVRGIASAKKVVFGV